MLKALGVVFVWAVLWGTLPAHAVSLPDVFADNMVLQRDRAIPLWGDANPGEIIMVKFGNQKKMVTGKPNGKWLAQLDPMPANNKPTTLAIEGDNVITINNVVVGDVWICSGQSNMEWRVSRSLQAQREVATADHPMIRHFKVKRQVAQGPLTRFQGAWRPCSPETVSHFTAVGYFFARRIHQELSVPIGIINATWGGTRIEPWTPAAGFLQFKDQWYGKRNMKLIDAGDPKTEAGQKNYAKDFAALERWLELAKAGVKAGHHPPIMPATPRLACDNRKPTSLYNAMIAPMVPFSIRGVIWYQGEANLYDKERYHDMKRVLVNGWREAWGQGDFPFYWVQLANYTFDSRDPEGGDGFAGVREAQRRALEISNTGMAVSIDVGDAADIHPQNKQDVGDRLARLALAREYGVDIVSSGPLYKGHVIEGNKIRLSFHHVGSGLMVGKKAGLAATVEVPDGELARFAIAGSAGKWVWANAVVDGDTVVVSSPEVPEPSAVRYAYSGNPVGANLYNKEGLPASPFRTDE